MSTTKSFFKDTGEMILFSLSAIVFVLTYFGARLFLGHFAMENWLRIGVALIPVIPFLAFLWMLIRCLGRMDELQRRIQLEALAVAFPLSFLLLLVLGLLEKAIKLNPEDWSYRHVWFFLPIFYLFGLILAKRRYQ